MSNLITAGNASTPYHALLQSPLDAPFNGREFWVLIKTCEDLFCDCGGFRMDLFPPERLSLADRLFSMESTFDDDFLMAVEETPIQESAAEILVSCLTEDDIELIREIAEDRKALLIENISIGDKNLYHEFPAEAKKVGYMATFNSVFPMCYNFSIGEGYDDYLITDSYCVNSRCNCTKVYISGFKGDQEIRDFSIYFNYETQYIIYSKNNNIKPDIADIIIAQLKSKYKDFEARLAKRNQVMRNLYEKDEKKRPMFFLSDKIKALTSPKKISRNEICFCGSGKKYKHCHGK